MNATATTPYAWISVMGADYVEVEVVERDGRLLVDRPTLDRMAVAAVRADLLGDADETADQLAQLLASPMTDDPAEGLYDVTESYGGPDMAEQMRVEPDDEEPAHGYIDAAGYDLDYMAGRP